MSDEQAVWDALKALLVATDFGGDVYDYGKVPGADGNAGTIPTVFAVLSIERRYVEPNKASGTGRTGWRVSVRYVGDYASNARTASGWVSNGFELAPGRGKKITVNGEESTPIVHESTQAVAADGDRYSGLSQWTLAL